MFRSSFKIRRVKQPENVKFDNQVLQQGVTAAGPIQIKGCFQRRSARRAGL